jgi:hypothetical protein
VWYLRHGREGHPAEVKVQQDSVAGCNLTPPLLILLFSWPLFNYAVIVKTYKPLKPEELQAQ